MYLKVKRQYCKIILFSYYENNREISGMYWFQYWGKLASSLNYK